MVLKLDFGQVVHSGTACFFCIERIGSNNDLMVPRMKKFYVPLCKAVFCGFDKPCRNSREELEENMEKNPISPSRYD